MDRKIENHMKGKLLKYFLKKQKREFPRLKVPLYYFYWLDDLTGPFLKSCYCNLRKFENYLYYPWVKSCAGKI